MEMSSRNNDGYGLMKVSVLLLSLIFLVFCKTSNSQRTNSECDFHRSELTLNNLKLFGMDKKEVERKFNLSQDRHNTYISEDNRNIQFIFEDGELIYFNIAGQDFKMKFPKIEFGMDKKELLKRINKKEAAISPDLLGSEELQSLEIWDCDENRLRIYLKEDKVFCISYFAYEDLHDLNEPRKN